MEVFEKRGIKKIYFLIVIILVIVLFTSIILMKKDKETNVIGKLINIYPVEYHSYSPYSTGGCSVPSKGEWVLHSQCYFTAKFKLSKNLGNQDSDLVFYAKGNKYSVPSKNPEEYVVEYQFAGISAEDFLAEIWGKTYSQVSIRISQKDESRNVSGSAYLIREGVAKSGSAYYFFAKNIRTRMSYLNEYDPYLDFDFKLINYTIIGDKITFFYERNNNYDSSFPIIEITIGSEENKKQQLIFLNSSDLKQFKIPIGKISDETNITIKIINEVWFPKLGDGFTRYWDYPSLIDSNVVIKDLHLEKISVGDDK